MKREQKCIGKVTFNLIQMRNRHRKEQLLDGTCLWKWILEILGEQDGD